MTKRIELKATSTKAPMQPGEVYGWLTFCRLSIVTRANGLFRCQCGEQFWRETKSVRRAVANGTEPKCVECERKAAT
jgi:predicted SprT family Zn-dependent metalloprotease